MTAALPSTSTAPAAISLPLSHASVGFPPSAHVLPPTFPPHSQSSSSSSNMSFSHPSPSSSQRQPNSHSPTYIHNLPDEILTHIFDHPDIANETLFNVSLSSKRLHLFALPLYLARFGIKDPVKSSLILFQSQTQVQGSLSDKSPSGCLTNGGEGVTAGAGSSGWTSSSSRTRTNSTPPRTSRTGRKYGSSASTASKRRPVVLDALSGLRVGLYVTRVERLACRFEKMEDENEEFGAVLGHLERLLAFVKRLTWVSRVLLVFDNEHCCCCSTPVSTSPQPTNGGPTTSTGSNGGFASGIDLLPSPSPLQDGFGIGRRRPASSPSCPGLDGPLRDWTGIFGDVLNELMRKGCEELVVQNGRYMAHAYSFKTGKDVVPEKPPSKTKTLRVIKNLFGRKTQDGRRQRSGSSGESYESQGREKDEEPALDVLKGESWLFRRTKETGDAPLLTELDPTLKVPPCSSSPSLKLSKFTIQSMMFLFPPLLHWTISVMKYAPLRSLTLANLSINRKCWPVLFSLIADAAPQIIELRLLRLRLVLPVELAHFLSRLPNLKNLHIGRDVECHDSYDLPVLPDFPRLVSLYAPAAWVFKLLSSQRTGVSRLENLTIVYHLRNDGFSHWLKRSSTPSIPILLQEQQRPLTLGLEVYLGNSPGWRMSEDVNHFSPRQVYHQQQQQPTLTLSSTKRHSLPLCDDDVVDAVTSLTLIVDQELKKADLSLGSILPRWLALFYGLRQLAIRTHSRAMSEAEAVALVKRIAAAGALAAVSNVEVNGVEVDVEMCGVTDKTELHTTDTL